MTDKDIESITELAREALKETLKHEPDAAASERSIKSRHWMQRYPLPDAYGDFLLIRTQTGEPAWHRLEGEVVSVGRSPENDIVLSVPTVSRRQFVLHSDGTHWLLREVDPPPRNRTRIDGEPCGERYLWDGVHIEAGAASLMFRSAKPEA